jgi:hypothetical protein
VTMQEGWREGTVVGSVMCSDTIFFSENLEE